MQRNQRVPKPSPATSSAVIQPGFALATLAGEDTGPPVSFEAVLGSQNFARYLPVDQEAVNKGVEQFRRHIGKVLRHDSAELEEFIGCMGFSEEEIRKWQQEQNHAEQAADRVKRVTEGAEKEIREAEQRRRLERDLGPDARGRRIDFNQVPGRQPYGVPAPARGPTSGRFPPGYRGPPMGRGDPNQLFRGPPPGFRGPVSRGPPRGLPSGLPTLPRGVPPPRGHPAGSAEPSGPIASTKLNPKDVVLEKSAAFIERVHQEPVDVTKKELDQHTNQLEVEVSKIREQVTRELNERYKKVQSETSTLVEVKNELTRVDHVIAAEVSNIREKIEAATAELNEAQEDFDYAEAEFIAAKLNKKMFEDYKAELTEYLVSLIQENQKKKTEKLEELYMKLSKSLESSSQGPSENALVSGAGNPEIINEVKLSEAT